MQSVSDATANIVTELRSSFDRSFADSPPPEASEQLSHLLAVRVEGDPYAILINEVSSLIKNRKTVAIPGSAPELLGIVGIRGVCVPVYCLAALLGDAKAKNKTQWLVLCNLEEPLAFAFGELEGYFWVPLTQAYTAKRETARPGLDGRVICSSDTVRAVISIPSLIQIVKRRCETQHVFKEQ
jgi:chemotaxis signal transduction protein